MVRTKWLGYLDSNQGIPGSKPGALPLGDTPEEMHAITIQDDAGDET